MSDVARIRGFLLQHPKPHLVRVSTGDAEPQLLRPTKSFARLAETISALSAELVECLDTEKRITRALRLTTADARRSDAAEIPDGIKADPNALMLTHFANLIHRAYEHSTEVAFAKMVEFAERMGDRSEAIEARLERVEAANRRLIQDQIDDAFERAEEQAQTSEPGDMLTQMAGAFLGGMSNGQAKAAPTNGAAVKAKG